MDEDVTSDDLIGEGSFNLASIYTLPPNLANNGTLEFRLVYVDLTFQGRGAGRVLLSIMHTGGGNMGGGWGGNMGGGWNQQQQPMGGNWGGQQQGWNQPPNNGWGQQQGFQPQGQQGWGGNQGQQGWGGNQGQQGWGNPGNNNGW